MTKEQFKRGFISAVPYISAGAVQIPFLADTGSVNEVMMVVNLGIGGLLFYFKC